MENKNLLEKIIEIGKKTINIIPDQKGKVQEEVVEEENIIDESTLTREERIVNKLKIKITPEISTKEKKKVEQKQKTSMLFFLDRMKEVTKSCNTRDGNNKVYDVVTQRLMDINFNITTEEAFKKRYNEGKPEYEQNNLFMPAGYYSIRENTIYMKVEPYLRENLGKGELPKMAFTTLIHETLHAVSTNQKDKAGLMIALKNKKGDESIIGRGLNEAATVDLTEKVIGKSRVNGYSLDYKEVLNTVRSIADIKEKEYLKMYFLDNKWYNKELEERFNPLCENKNSLKKIIVNYDNRSITSKFNKDVVIKNLYEGFSSNYIEKKDTEKEKYKEKFVENMSSIVDYFDADDIDLQMKKYIKKASETKLEREENKKESKDKDQNLDDYIR